MNSPNIKPSLVAASRILRAHIGELYRCSQAERIILCPGQLIGIVHVMHALHFRSVLLTDEEYYTADHFPGMEVFVCKAEEAARVTVRKSPDAVLMSLVSWKGRPLPVQREFRRIRAVSRDRPLLICDFAHAGAVGFPIFGRQQVDLICGDLHKWVFPSDHMAQIAYLWPTTPSLYRALSRTFRGYYVACNQSVERAARWISPQDLLSVAHWLQTSNLTRRALLKKYKQNFALAVYVAKSLGLDSPASCILWLSEHTANQQVRQLEAFSAREGVEVWRTSGGWRVVCSSLFQRESS